jgi:hypothetical protein
MAEIGLSPNKPELPYRKFRISQRWIFRRNLASWGGSSWIQVYRGSDPMALGRVGFCVGWSL